MAQNPRLEKKNKPRKIQHWSTIEDKSMNVKMKRSFHLPRTARSRLRWPRGAQVVFQSVRPGAQDSSTMVLNAFERALNGR